MATISAASKPSRSVIRKLALMCQACRTARVPCNAAQVSRAGGSAKMSPSIWAWIVHT